MRVWIKVKWSERGRKKTETQFASQQNRICRILCNGNFYFWIYNNNGFGKMLTCKLSPPPPPPTKCVRDGPSLCRCVRDCSAFTVKIMVVSKRITLTTHIWQRRLLLLLLLLLRPQPLPIQYRWQFDDCILCIFFVTHALCFLINTMFTLCCFIGFFTVCMYVCVKKKPS